MFFRDKIVSPQFLLGRTHELEWIQKAPRKIDFPRPQMASSSSACAASRGLYISPRATRHRSAFPFTPPPPSRTTFYRISRHRYRFAVVAGPAADASPPAALAVEQLVATKASGFGSVSVLGTSRKNNEDRLAATVNGLPTSHGISRADEDPGSGGCVEYRWFILTLFPIFPMAG